MNSELEKLLEYALADGHLSEKDKRVLFKKAEKLGFDPEELEIILEARLNSNLKEHKIKLRRCSACGEVLKTLNPKCPACDYINTDTEDELYEYENVQDLLEELEQDVKNYKSFTSVQSNDAYKNLLEDIEKDFAYITQKYGSDPEIKTKLDELRAQILEGTKKHKNVKTKNLIILTIILGSILSFCIYVYWSVGTSPIRVTEKYIDEKNIAKARATAETIEEKDSREFYLFQVKLLEADSLVAIKKYDEGLAIFNLITNSYDRAEKINAVIEKQVTELIMQKKYEEAFEKAKTASYITESSLKEKIEFAQKNDSKK